MRIYLMWSVRYESVVQPRRGEAEPGAKRLSIDRTEVLLILMIPGEVA